MLSLNREFETLEITRQNFLKVIEGLTDEQLLKIPCGFNNNILWNIGHCVSASQGLTYGRSGLDMNLPTEFISYFKKGSTPKEWTSSPDVNMIKDLLFTTILKMKKDYENGVFKTYSEYPTSYGVTLRSIEDAISFNNIHEGLHLGYAMALKKSVVNN